MTWTPKKLTRAQMEDRRRQPARLIRQGELSYSAIARHLSVSLMAVSLWAEQLVSGGLRALKSRAIAGRPARLSRQQGKDLLPLLERGPVAAGLSIGGKIYNRRSRLPIGGDLAAMARKHMRRQAGGRFILIWGRAPTHGARVAQAHLRKQPEIYRECLPAYAPGPNPEEFCHGDVKERIRNSPPQSVAGSQGMVGRGLARLRRGPDLLLSFFHHAGLTVKQLW